MRTSPRLALILLSVCSIAPLAGQGTCPPLMAGLMPSNAANVQGHYAAMGDLGLGSATADLSLPVPCLEQVKYPGHLSVDVKHYGGKATKVFTMQIDAEERERFESQRHELDRRRHRAVAGPIMTEPVGGGTIAYYDYSIVCDATTGARRYRAFLIGVAHTSTTAINIEIEGTMTAAKAKSLAEEILGKFAKAQFD